MEWVVLNKQTIDKLKSSWGDKATSMACMAEVRVYDPLSSWECFIFAMNPEDEDEIECIVKVSKHQPPSVERWFVTNIKGLFNQEGEGVEVDKEYRPRRTAELFKKLSEHCI